MIISLIGYRGSSKSTLAPRLAERLGWDWIDADVELERRAGQSIREIFAAEGEPGFRQRERDVIADLVQRDRLVLAAGGGAILDKRNRRLLSGAGPVLWLTASPETLYRRISGDGTTAERRPQLSGGGLEEVQRLLTLRTPLYRACSSAAIDTENRTAEEVLTAALDALRGLGVNS